ncbi:hypothetical protein BLNAU_13480 [Blattamonas nauphoetae]|uniref:Uncharacterized protein n=1 Tax=Blattamonas nauphoetae TaxID=2049346 RepID=A0ABQ9XMW4_9EUKA|nr:hypothetical protein BLNAU_13480 [Blattamonas nauphoetae]
MNPPSFSQTVQKSQKRRISSELENLPLRQICPFGWELLDASLGIVIKILLRLHSNPLPLATQNPNEVSPIDVELRKCGQHISNQLALHNRVQVTLDLEGGRRVHFHHPRQQGLVEEEIDTKQCQFVNVGRSGTDVYFDEMSALGLTERAFAGCVRSKSPRVFDF